MYISIYICSPVKQKNTEFFQKKAKNRKIPDKNKNGTILPCYTRSIILRNSAIMIPSKQPKNQSRFKYFEK